jgi:hypothetical protein
MTPEVLAQIKTQKWWTEADTVSRVDFLVAIVAEYPTFDMRVNWPGNGATTELTCGNKLQPVVVVDLMGRLWLDQGSRSIPWSPSTDWGQGGPIYDKHRIELMNYVTEHQQMSPVSALVWITKAGLKDWMEALVRMKGLLP